MANEVIQYDAMCNAIAIAYKVDEVKNIRDKAVALEHYARISKNFDAEIKCINIRLRAERKAGELIKQQPKSKPGPAGNSVDRGHRTMTLREQGISKDQSADWQKIASIPEDIFEQALTVGHRPTTKSLIHIANQISDRITRADVTLVPHKPEALWVWGRLLDFEEEVLHLIPGECLETMTFGMLRDVHRLAPKVAEWLLKLERSDQ